MIKFNGKDIVPRFNGKDVSRVMYNGKQIYPSNKGIDPATAPNGVYVYANDDKLYNPEEWNTANNDSAVGVAVVTDDCKFAISKGEKPPRAWSDSSYMTDISGLTNYDSYIQAETDFNGESNTSIIREAISNEDASNNAAHYCYSQTVSINGRVTIHGYLPALGELRIAYNNKSTIDSTLNLIGGTAIPTDDWLWSSTERYSESAWRLNWSNGSPFGSDKFVNYQYAVPFFSLT